MLSVRSGKEAESIEPVFCSGVFGEGVDSVGEWISLGTKPELGLIVLNVILYK